MVEQTRRPRPIKLTAAMRRLFLAGIGAAALAQEELETLVNRLVEKGEIVEEDGRKLLKETFERRKREVEETEKEIDARIERIVTQVLAQLNIPTRSDIETLNQRIAELTKKIEELQKS